MNRIDVVMPAYNAGRYIAAAVGAALAQQGVSVHVLVVDDGSTDDTADIVAGINDPRVTLIRHAHQRGPAAARNSGVRQGDAPWLAFLDADDLWPSTRTESMIAHLGQHPADIVFGHMLTFADGATLELNGEFPVAGLPIGPTPGTTLIRRTLYDDLGGFNESLTMGDFIDLVARARSASRIELQVPCVALLRRAHATNMTRHVSTGAGDYLRLIAEHLARAPTVKFDEDLEHRAKAALDDSGGDT